MFSVQEIHRSSFSEAFLFQLSDSSHTALESFTHIFFLYQLQQSLRLVNLYKYKKNTL